MNLFSLVRNCAVLVLITNSSMAKEGMYPPAMIAGQMAAMHAAGLQLKASDIYNSEAPALNDAVMIFNGGCTAELVSANGLLLTNHHCGYDNVQALSTPEQNYLLQGFFAKSRAEELPCPGLKVGFVRKVANVTEYMLSGITDSTAEEERSRLIAERSIDLAKSYQKLSKYKAEVKPFFGGNEYWVTLLQEYEDVRLVAFPPNGIGKFGGDTDNWMWPRHTGDFSVFRIYADATNQPASYAATNVPYKPQRFLTINTGGVQEGDFSMVYGFPYRTTEYLSSWEVQQIQEDTDPTRIRIRGARLAAWDKTMRPQQDVFLKYASKQSSVSNGWKKWQGEVRGLEINNVIAKKQAYENLFQKTAEERRDGNASLLPKIEALVTANGNNIAANEYIRETVLAIEAIRYSGWLDKILKIYRNDTLTSAEQLQDVRLLKSPIADFYKNYDRNTDINAFDTLMPIYLAQTEINAVPASVRAMLAKNGGRMDGLRSLVFDHGIVAQQRTFEAMVDQPNPNDTNLIKEDPAYQIYAAVVHQRDALLGPALSSYQKQLEVLSRKYIRAILAYNIEQKEQWPDANQTLRLTYGPVLGIMPAGSHEYSFITNLDEAVAKYNPNLAEFNMPAKLRQLYATKDYGRWAVNGSVPIAFIAQNHTSGGNSGSPVLNKRGELIGINFDRVWDGTMSDIYYDPKLSRNISVDIRYVLFILEKYGNAGWLIKEMKLNNNR